MTGPEAKDKWKFPEPPLLITAHKTLQLEEILDVHLAHFTDEDI